MTRTELKAIRLDTRGKSPAVGWKIARRIRREIVKAEYKDIQNLSRKIEVLAHFYFLRSRTEGLFELRDILERKVPRYVWDNTLFLYFNMMREFDEAAVLSKQSIDKTRFPDPFLGLHLSSLLIAGDVESALDFGLSLVGSKWDRLDQSGKKQVGQFLTHIGKFDALSKKQLLDAELDDLSDGMEALAGSPAPTLPILCVSLDRDHRRLQTTREFMPKSSRLIHSKALLGSSLPRRVLDAGAIGHNIRTDAEIGCSLSHMKAWETAAEMLADEDYALIVEDDARFIYGPGNGLQQIVDKAVVAGAGVVFVNISSTRKVPTTPDPANFDLLKLERFGSEFEANDLRQGPGWGAYGYLLNGRTAKYLSKVWLDVGLNGALDWQLYLMGQRDLDQISMAPKYRGAMESLKAARDTGKDPYFVDGYVSELSIITTEDYGYSAINSGHL